MARNDVEAIVASLEEDIIFGRLRPRERLVEDVLVARFKAKRHIVRQALAALERMGIVARPPNKGAMVRDFSAQEVEQIYAMRELLQRHAAGLIALPADPKLIARLEEIHAAHSTEVVRRNLRAVYHLNNEFHDALFGACGNPYLAEAIRHYAWIAHAIRSYRIGDPTLIQRARDEHGQMIAALRAGDRATLERLCVEHIQPSKRAYLAAAGWIEELAPPRQPVEA